MTLLGKSLETNERKGKNRLDSVTKATVSIVRRRTFVLYETVHDIRYGIIYEKSVIVNKRFDALLFCLYNKQVLRISV